MKPKTLMAVVLLMVMVGAGVASFAQGPGDADRFFGLEWMGGERRGRPNVNGYVVNNSHMPAGNVRLRVEGFAATGAVVTTAQGVVPEVPAGGRVYFEVPVKEKAARYRVTITSWDWRSTGQ